jgi:mono/diheme cytochrome c family protein
MSQRSKTLIALLALVLAAAASLSREEPKAPAPGPPPKAAEEAGDVSRGAVSYRVYCSTCHGRAARGDGKLAEALRQRPADLTRLAARNGGTFDAEKVQQLIDGRETVPAHGDSDMPVWGLSFRQGANLETGGETMSEEDVRARLRDLVAYLATLQVKDER